MPTLTEVTLKELTRLSQEYSEFRSQVENNEFTELGAEVNTSHFIFLAVMQSNMFLAAILQGIENIHSSQESILSYLKNDTNSQDKKLSDKESVIRQAQHLLFCPICNLPFKTEDDLSRHLTNWHPDIPGA